PGWRPGPDSTRRGTIGPQSPGKGVPMRRLILLAGAAALSLGFAPTPRRASNEAELRRLQGTWEQVVLRLDGEDIPVVRGDTTASISGKRLRFAFRGKVISEWEVLLHAGSNPKVLDLRASDGATIPGIYRLDRDRLTVCYRAHIGTGKRPAGFKSDSGVSLEVLVRK